MVKKVIRMYQTGQYVRYRGNGVFRVQNIVSKRLKDGKEKQYYVLEGVFGMEMRITTPMTAGIDIESRSRRCHDTSFAA